LELALESLDVAASSAKISAVAAIANAIADKEKTNMTQALGTAFKDLDRLLRGEATQLAALKRGHIEIDQNKLPWIIIAMGVLYGACMGCFALANSDFKISMLQTLSSMGKVPILFFATLLVTFPSLYVFNALVGSRLTLVSVWRLLLSALAVMMTILASLGPIVAFFSISTTNYPFMLLLNVVVFGLSGFLGLKFLLGTLQRLTVVLYEKPVAPTSSHVEAELDEVLAKFAESDVKQGALDRVEARALAANVKQVFGLWMIAFGLVGSQMAWVLRPFISDPQRTEFVLFAQRESNFFAAVIETLFRAVGLS